MTFNSVIKKLEWVIKNKAKKRYYSDEAMYSFFKETLVLLKENNKIQKENAKQNKYLWQTLEDLEKTLKETKQKTTKD